MTLYMGTESAKEFNEAMDKYTEDMMTPDKEATEFGHSPLTLEQLTEKVSTLEGNARSAGKSAKGAEKLNLSKLSDDELKHHIFITGKESGQSTRHNKLMDEFMRRNLDNESPEERVAREEYVANRKMSQAIIASRRGNNNTPSQKFKRKKR